MGRKRVIRVIRAGSVSVSDQLPSAPDDICCVNGLPFHFFTTRGGGEGEESSFLLDDDSCTVIARALPKRSGARAPEQGHQDGQVRGIFGERAQTARPRKSRQEHHPLHARSRYGFGSPQPPLTTITLPPPPPPPPPTTTRHVTTHFPLLHLNPLFSLSNYRAPGCHQRGGRGGKGLGGGGLGAHHALHDPGSRRVQPKQGRQDPQEAAAHRGRLGGNRRRPAGTRADVRELSASSPWTTLHLRATPRSCGPTRGSGAASSSPCSCRRPTRSACTRGTLTTSARASCSRASWTRSLWTSASRYSSTPCACRGPTAWRARDPGAAAASAAQAAPAASASAAAPPAGAQRGRRRARSRRPSSRPGSWWTTT